MLIMRSVPVPKPKSIEIARSYDGNRRAIEGFKNTIKQCGSDAGQNFRYR